VIVSNNSLGIIISYVCVYCKNAAVQQCNIKTTFIMILVYNCLLLYLDMFKSNAKSYALILCKYIAST